MRRRSDRGKTKAPTTEESPEKSSRKSHKHSRKRRKSSSDDDESKSPIKDLANSEKPLDVKLQDIALPQGENPVAVPTTNNQTEGPKSSEEPQNDWKEDKSFWETETPKESSKETEETPKEKEESSLWKVQSANGAGGGEIQKLKICRQRPTESPEIGDSSLHKRLSRGARDNRSTDESAHEESEKETKRSKHRTRTSSRNSPLVSPTVVCEDSPTKIKIINVSHLNTDSKITNSLKMANEDAKQEKDSDVLNLDQDSPPSDTLDIALPAEPPAQKSPEVQNKDSGVDEREIPLPGPPAPTDDKPSKEVEDTNENKNVERPKECDKQPSEVTKEEDKESPKKSAPPSPSPTKEDKPPQSSGSSSEGSDSSEDKSKPRKVKKKRRRELQSSVQRKQASASPKHESSDSEEEDQKKKEEERRGSTETQDNKEAVNHQEKEADISLPKIDEVPENSEKKEEPRPMPRKRRWGSSKANRPNKKPVLNISTDSLKNLIPDAKPVPAEELQLSVEEEEGQLDDDDDEDEVVVLVAKEEEKQLELERQKEERKKAKEKEKEEKRKREERFKKIETEKPVTSSNTSEKGAPSRKILLLTDDAKKLARSPSPPRHKPTSVLYISNLVRPFTVQQLKNLLLRTGTIAENGFWIDKIKSKCYVEYTTEDAAVETRHALHGVRWPTSNPKTLQVEFASHDDLVMAQALSEEPDVPRKSEPLTMVEGWVADQARLKEKTRKAIVREWDVGKPEHPDEALEYEMKMKEKREQERRAKKERVRRSRSPEHEPPARKSRRKEEDAPAKLLDDLFRKTKTSPCIYWLPLTQEQIAVKEEIRRQHMAEHERRMAELKKAEVARRDRERRNRK